MNEQELNKFIEDESARVKKQIIFNLQKIIDIKKILKPEQLEKIKIESQKEADARKKKIEERIKMRAKSNETGYMKSIEKIKETKNGFLKDH